MAARRSQREVAMMTLAPHGPTRVSFVPWLRRECAPDVLDAPDAPEDAPKSSLPRRGPRVRPRRRLARFKDAGADRTLRWIVDGPSVATCRVTDDPREERALLRRLAILLDVYARTHGDPITAVFDGPPFPVVASGAVAFDLQFVPEDERPEALVRAVAASPRPHDTYVATGSAAVGAAARSRGAQIIPARVFRGWLESLRW
jgi:hypothetical protein